MGTDIHTKLIKYNRNTMKWEEITLHNAKGIVLPFFSGRNSELFDILCGHEDDNFHPIPIDISILPDQIKKEVISDQNMDCCFHFHELTLADLKIYTLMHPTIRDWDYEENHPKAYKKNPMVGFYEDAIAYINIADILYLSLSDIKIIYWFDC